MVADEEDSDSQPSSMSSAMFSITADIQYTNTKMSGVVVVKRGPVVEAEKPLSTQLRLMTLGEGSPYETLHDYVAGAVAPYFKSFVRDSGKADREGKKKNIFFREIEVDKSQTVPNRNIFTNFMSLEFL